MCNRSFFTCTTLSSTHAALHGNDNRIALWDNVKFFLIITVVLGHFVEPYTGNSNLYKALFLFVYSFHMPLFIFISGLFHKNENIPQKAAGFMAIYIANKILHFFVELTISGESSFSLFTESGLPWFMFVLAIYSVLTFWLRNVNTLFLLIFAILTACFTGYDREIGDFLVLSRTIVYYPFYLLGILINREALASCSKRLEFKLLGFFILLSFAILFYIKLDDFYILRHLFTGRNPYKDSIRNIGFLLRISVYLLTSVLGFAFIMLTPSGCLPGITRFGSKTLQIYFWHITIRTVLSVLSVDQLFFSFGRIGKLCWLLAAIGVTYLCSFKLFQFPTFYLQRLPYQVTPERACCTPKQ